MCQVNIKNIVGVLKEIAPYLKYGDLVYSKDQVIIRNLTPLDFRYKLKRGILKVTGLELNEKTVTSFTITKFGGLKIYEQDLVEKILNRLSQCGQANKHLINFTYFSSSFLLQAICEFTNEEKKHYFDDGIILQSLIAFLEQWSQRTYEGVRVDISFCIRKSLDTIDIQQQTNTNRLVFFHEVIKDDFIALLSELGNSSIELDRQGRIIGHISANGYINENSQCLSELNSLKSVVPECCIISLLQNGEIVIVRKGIMIFAKRRGQWRAFDRCVLNAVFSKLNCKNDLLGDVLYSLLLDVSFARTGGGLTVINETRTDIINCLRENSPSKVTEKLIDLVNVNDIYDDELKTAVDEYKKKHTEKYKKTEEEQKQKNKKKSLGQSVKRLRQF